MSLKTQKYWIPTTISFKIKVLSVKSTLKKFKIKLIILGMYFYLLLTIIMFIILIM